MESKWKPSLVVRVDALADEFSGKDGRTKFLNEYIDTQEAGQPWVIPSELLDIQQVKPLSLNDLAINEAVTIDKKTVAGIINVPAFIVGAGQYNKSGPVLDIVRWMDWMSWLYWKTLSRSAVLGIRKN
jgi:hypothetical protein